MFVSSENDIQPFLESRLDERMSNICTYNINGKPRLGNICNGTCITASDFFVVHHNGKARIVRSTPTDLYKKRATYKILAPAVQPESNSSDGYQCIVANLRHHHFSGTVIKNCMLCKHQTIGKISGIWCRLKSIKIISSDAVQCKDYTPFKNMAEAKAAEQKNLSEHIEHSNQLAERMLRGYR